MGSFVDFKCVSCGYEQESIGVGHGKAKTPYLKLCTCAGCKTISSAWISDQEEPRCGVCYEKNPTLLEDSTRLIDCPRCGQTATISPRTETWE